MNSPHPSTTWLPMLAAWFLRHSRYLINGVEVVVVVVAAVCVVGGGGCACACAVLGGFDPTGVLVMLVVTIGDELRSGSVLGLWG